MKNTRYYNYTEEYESYEYCEEDYEVSYYRGYMRNSYTSASISESVSFDESCFYLDAKLFA